MSMLFENEVRLGDSVLDGQVFLLDTPRVVMHAPTKAKPWFKVEIGAALAPGGAPDEKSVDWLVKPGCRLFVLLQLPDGTFDTTAFASGTARPPAPKETAVAESFRDELQRVINRFSQENQSDTPDFILARYMENALDAFETAVRERDEWWGFKPWGQNKAAAPAPASPVVPQ